MTCGPAVRRVLEQTPVVELVQMNWDERWAQVVFHEGAGGIDELRKCLMPAGAWCAPWPQDRSAP